MKYLQFENHIPKIVAFVAASLILPGLALPGKDNDNGKQYGRTINGRVSPVPIGILGMA
jgi:hypothetical protein